MRLRLHLRLFLARTFTAPALIGAFVAGIAAAVPTTLWLGVGRREVVRVVRPGGEGGAPPASGPFAAARPEANGAALTPALKRSLREIERWARPASRSSAAVDEILAEISASSASSASSDLSASSDSSASALSPECASAEVRGVLDRQLALQRTIAGSRLALDPFGNTALLALSSDARASEAAIACLAAALEGGSTPQSSPPPADRAQRVRLLARLTALSPALSPSGARAGADAPSQALAAALERETTRAVEASSEGAMAPVYALHAYLLVQRDVSAAGQAVGRAIRAQPDPAVQAALREVASHRYSELVAQTVL